MFRIFQIVSQFPVYFAFFKRFLNFARISQIPVSQSHVMGQLPQERLKPAPAWSFTSLDFFGPFEIRGETNKRSRGKAYGVLFTCMLCRAVHLDLATDYSTNGFLIVLRRFMSLRGYPSKLRSDTGSQLVAANKELKAVIKRIDKNKLKEFGFDWDFSSPDAPWQNGCSKALVKSGKKAIKNAIGSQILMFSELMTVFYEVANLVNERPIGRQPKDPDDGSFLSPYHLFLGRATPHIPLTISRDE